MSNENNGDNINKDPNQETENKPVEIDFSDPRVQEQLDTRIKEAVGAIEAEYIPRSEVEGLVNNRDKILDEFKTLKDQFKGVTKEDIDQLKSLRQAGQTDEVVKLMQDGKMDEAKQLLGAAQESEWAERVTSAEAKLAESQAKVEELQGFIVDFETKQKEQNKKDYLSGLTMKDDAFNKAYFDDFYQLYGNQVVLQDGEAFVAKTDGSVLTENGSPVKFSSFYDKMKVEKPLFWKQPEGSSEVGNKAAKTSNLGKDPRKWSREQRNAYIKEHGAPKYGELISKASQK